MSKLNLKHNAQTLRRKGLSLNEIVKKIGISKSTASLWCRDILLTKSQIISLGKRAHSKNYIGALKGAQSNRFKRELVLAQEKQKAQEFLGTFSNREICIIGTALYWAEGNKTGRTFGIANSDPFLILICMKWLEIEFNKNLDDYLPRLFINIFHRNRELEIKKYWSTVTKIPLSQFRNSAFIQSKHKKIFPNASSYMGVMHLRVKKSSQILYRALAQVKIIRELCG